jgi:phosphonoacetaldehyde hydrolase
MNRLYKANGSGRLKAVIFDWAGTTVDFGCFAPTGVFIDVFRQKGIEITQQEARGPMGMHKRDHIRMITRYTRVATEWIMKYNRICTEEDIEDMFRKFIPIQLSVIEKHSEIIPELPDAIRSMDMKIGSTTGYNREMMNILTVAASRQGYKPDSVVCSTDVSAGRPAPWMAFRNAENLGIYPMNSIVKIGDTVSDIEEGINAGMWSVGVVMSSNEMGLTQKEISMMKSPEIERRKLEVRDTFMKAGADYVIDNLSQVGELFEKINSRLAISSNQNMNSLSKMNNS